MSLERTMVAADSLPGAASEPIELVRGTTVDRYLVLEQLGAGGMGVVYAAYDPELERKVALKLVLPVGGAGDGRARLLREAQALAQLSHPNVVAVHDVGTHWEQVWIAMEFVAGSTLGVWAKQRTRRWPELLQALTDAARGVAAAHAAGLVHRDLKPDNVMIGRDGRVRVMDFGLALGQVEDGEETAEELALATTAEPYGPGRSSVLAQRLTMAGAIQGTPAYMAAEQWQGRDATVASDQYAWCVMAWFVLYGRLPIDAGSLTELVDAVVHGRITPPPRGRGVPGWLRRVIERGLDPDPARRWPTMDALLAALGRGRTRARVRGIAAALVGAAALAVALVVARQWRVERREAACAAAGEALAAVWNDEARAGLQGAFAATGAGNAATAADRVRARLDEYVAGWQQARTQVCLDAEVRRTWSAGLGERAAWCLEDRQSEVEALVAELTRADAAVVQKAVSAVTGLRPTSACLDEGTLIRQPAPPSATTGSEGGREALREVRARLSRASSLRRAGRYKEGLAEVVALHGSPALLAWPPLQAAARAQEAALLLNTGAFEAAEALGSSAYFEAADAGAWEVAAGAAMQVSYTVGARLSRHAEGRMWARLARLAIVQAGDRDELMEAMRLTTLANSDQDAGAYAEARASGERALEIRVRALGPDHPDVADSLTSVANSLLGAGAYAEARPLMERALAVRERALGPDHPEVARALLNLGTVVAKLGDDAAATRLTERALALLEVALGPDHPDVGVVLNNLTGLYRQAGERAKGLAAGERTLAIFEEALGREHPNIASVLHNLAGIHTDAGEGAAARPLLERALAIREKALGPDHLAVGRSLVSLGGVLGLLGESDAALPLLERAVKIFAAEPGVQDAEVEAKAQLARALVATRGDRARAVALAREARDEARAGRGEPRTLAEVEAWLAEHDRG